MKFKDIPRLRLLSQHIIMQLVTTPEGLVAYLGAMQSQDYGMSKWAVGMRLRDVTESEIQSAFDAGKIIRTHLLRPTWHLVQAQDLNWMLDLSASRIRAAMSFRDRELGLTETILKKCLRIIEKTLADSGAHMTREELMLELNKKKIDTSENRGPHILLRAELERLICSGAMKGKKHTYALLEQRVPAGEKIKKEEALAKLAEIYFNSRGPASLADFTWWSGLSIAEAKQALEMVKETLETSEVNGEAYWMRRGLRDATLPRSAVVLLPAFDEFVISYRDRSAFLLAAHSGKAISNNGIFRPVILVDGQAMGIWKRTVARNKAVLEMEFFAKPPKSIDRSLQREATVLQNFMEMETEIVPY